MVTAEGVGGPAPDAGQANQAGGACQVGQLSRRLVTADRSLVGEEHGWVSLLGTLDPPSCSAKRELLLGLSPAHAALPLSAAHSTLEAGLRAGAALAVEALPTSCAPCAPCQFTATTTIEPAPHTSATRSTPAAVPTAAVPTAAAAVSGTAAVSIAPLFAAPPPVAWPSGDPPEIAWPSGDPSGDPACCDFFISRRQRSCRVPRLDGSRFCAAHQPSARQRTTDAERSRRAAALRAGDTLEGLSLPSCLGLEVMLAADARAAPAPPVLATAAAAAAATAGVASSGSSSTSATPVVILGYDDASKMLLVRRPDAGEPDEPLQVARADVMLTAAGALAAQGASQERVLERCPAAELERLSKQKRQRTNPLKLGYETVSPHDEGDGTVSMARGGALDIGSLFADASLPVHVSLACHLAVSRLLAAAEEHPTTNWLGLDMRRELVEAAQAEAEARGLANCAFGHANCWQFELLAPLLSTLGPISDVSVWQPDAWTKASHRQRRLVQPALIDCLERCLLPGARLLVASAVPAVITESKAILQAHPGAWSAIPHGDNVYRLMGDEGDPSPDAMVAFMRTT